MARPIDQSTVAGVIQSSSPEAFYERPVLTAVGNLHDLLAAGGSQNADPGIGMNPPQCVTGGTIVDNDDC